MREKRGEKQRQKQNVTIRKSKLSGGREKRRKEEMRNRKRAALETEQGEIDILAGAVCTGNGRTCRRRT
jgi:hypothetical protein